MPHRRAGNSGEFTSAPHSQAAHKASWRSALARLGDRLGTFLKHSPHPEQAHKRSAQPGTGGDYWCEHDPRDTVYSLRLLGAALDMQALDDKSRAITHEIHNAVNTLEGELDFVVTLAQLDANLIEYHPAPLKLLPLLERLRTRLEPAATGKQLAYTQSCPAELWVYSDAKLLEQVLAKMISNAIVCTDRGGIKVCAESHAESANIAVADTGPGVETVEQQRLLEAYRQLPQVVGDCAVVPDPGLATVRRLATLMDVGITIIANPGTGSCASLHLQLVTTKDTGWQQRDNDANSKPGAPGQARRW